MGQISMETYAPPGSLLSANLQRVKESTANSFLSTGSGAFLSFCATSCSPDHVPLVNQEQWSEELRISGKSFDGNLNWAVGAYFDWQNPAGQYERFSQAFGITQRASILYTSTSSRAGYGFAEYDLANLGLPGLKINGGIRYTRDSVDARTVDNTAFLPAPNLQNELAATLAFLSSLPDNSFSGLPLSVTSGIAAATVNSTIPDGRCEGYGAGGLFASECGNYQAIFDAWTWQAGASYQISPRHLIYGKVSRGYRPGGINGIANRPDLQQYQPEFDLSFELGIKADWNLGGDARLRTNIAAYRDRYTSIQQVVSIIDPGTGNLTAYVSNVAKARVQGLEFEGTLIPIAGLSLGLNYAYTDAKFKVNPLDRLPLSQRPNNPCLPQAIAATDFCSLDRFPGTPKHQVTISASYGFDLAGDSGRIIFGGDYYHQSSLALFTYSSRNPIAIEPGYGILNLNASWEGFLSRPIDLSFFITNVTNKLYAIGRDPNLSDSDFGAAAQTFGAPRMFGFSAKYRFGAGAE